MFTESEAEQAKAVVFHLLKDKNNMDNIVVLLLVSTIFEQLEIADSSYLTEEECDLAISLLRELPNNAVASKAIKMISTAIADTQ